MYFTRSLYFTFQLNFFRNKHKIHVQGTDLPDPIATFQQLDQEYKINSRLLQNILDAGFQIPTPIQMQAIPVMLHVSVKASECVCLCMCVFILFPLSLRSSLLPHCPLLKSLPCSKLPSLMPVPP